MTAIWAGPIGNNGWGVQQAGLGGTTITVGLGSPPTRPPWQPIRDPLPVIPMPAPRPPTMGPIPGMGPQQPPGLPPLPAPRIPPPVIYHPPAPPPPRFTPAPWQPPRPVPPIQMHRPPPIVPTPRVGFPAFPNFPRPPSRPGQPGVWAPSPPTQGRRAPGHAAEPPRPDPLPRMENAVKISGERRKPTATPSPDFISERAISETWDQCFLAAKLMATQERAGAPNVTLESRIDRIWVTTGLPDHWGKTKSDPASAAKAQSYVDSMLDKGLRVLVGVAWGIGDHTAATNHYLTIYQRDYDADGKVFYRFKDPGVTLEARSEGKLYVDGATGKMFRLGSDPSQNKAPLSNYEVTEVRTFKQFPPP